MSQINFPFELRELFNAIKQYEDINLLGDTQSDVFARSLRDSYDE